MDCMCGTIADGFTPDPKTQADFSNQVVDNVTEIVPGHQCYKLEQLSGISSGTNATIQMEYWSDFVGENDGKNQTFFACADIVSTMSLPRFFQKLAKRIGHSR
jgi:hypothetical protein